MSLLPASGRRDPVSGALGRALSRLAAGPAARPWPLWERHDPAAPGTIDHGAWGAFLRAYLRPGADGINRVAYGAVPPRDRDGLEAYLRRLAALSIGGYSRPEQRAYWINLYNALTVLTVLRHHPVGSITDIRLGGPFTFGPWDAELVAVEGTPLSLNDVEHRILRPIWRDPRLHYAVNCASLGCPNLASEPYTAAGTDALLDRGARDYVNHPRGARVVGGRLVASRIYAWYAADFGGARGVVEHLRRHARPELARDLSGVVAASRHAYDWGLNDPRA